MLMHNSTVKKTAQITSLNLPEASYPAFEVALGEGSQHSLDQLSQSQGEGVGPKFLLNVAISS